MFVLAERKNFLRVAAGKPWQWPGYAWQLTVLIARRVGNGFRLRLRGAEHRGLKQWPAWLGTRDFGTVRADARTMAFPRYATATESPHGEVLRQRFPPGDPEGYFATQRWGYCLEATLGDAVQAERALAEVLRWIGNPPAKSDAAWEPYSACERVVNLAVLLATKPVCWERLEAAQRQAVADFLAESAIWIHGRLEYYGPVRTNNHILNNARALVVAGRLLGNETLVDRGLALFTHMAQRLFLPEGFLRERSSHYQVVVVNWLLDVLHFGQSADPSGRTAAGAMAELRAIAERAAAATTRLLAADPMFRVHIGDVSPDSHPATTRMRLLCLYPEYFPVANDKADGLWDEWLFARAERHQLLACAVPARYPFDYTTHGHADLGSFVWLFAGRPLLVDPGRSSYDVDEVARMQCGPSWHNTLLVQGLPPLTDTVLTRGRWCPRPYAEAAVRCEYVAGEGLRIAHDGFSRVPGVGAYSRSITLDGDAIHVTDTLEGAGEVEIVLAWHFAPGLAPVDAPYPTLGDAAVQVRIECPPAAATKEFRWDWGDYQFSGSYGDRQQAARLQVHERVSLPWSRRTTLRVMRCAA